MRTIPLGLAGMGTVGTGVFKHLVENRTLLRERTGLEFDVRRVAVRDPAKARSVDVPPGLLTTDPDELLRDPDLPIVLELMGGVDRAFDFVSKAIAAGKIVVTGNKALLAERGEEIFRLAASAGVPVFFEAAVAGGIPIIKALREAFVGNHILSIRGILNGTCNYILTRMTAQGLPFADALREAQDLGFAEADPTLDISGWDAAHKAIILASLSYGFWVPASDIRVRGIDRVTADDIRFASLLGYRIKHLALIRADESRRVEVLVEPALIPEDHVLASVNGAFNAVAVRGDIVGETLFYGRGAGQDPTASSVLADIVEAGRTHLGGAMPPAFAAHALYGSCRPIEEIVSQFYLRLSVEDRPGVLGRVASLLGDETIGISSVIQPESEAEGDSVPLVLMLHDASFGQVGRAVEGLRRLDCVKAEPALLRVETRSSL